MFCQIRLYIILLVSGLSLSAAGQGPYNFYHLGLDKGLSDPRVNAIVQDKYGFMWFATPNGLNRYDGYTIRSFYAGTSAGSLPSNNILSLHSGTNGELWIGTSIGAVKYDFIKENFIRLDTTNETCKEISQNPVYDFEEDTQGITYIASTTGLFRYTPANNKWEDLSRHYNAENRMKQLRKLKFFNKDLLYAVSSGNMPFFEIDLAKDRIDSIHYKTEFGDSCCFSLFSIEKLNDEEMMIGFLSAGVSKLNVKTKQFSTVPGVMRKTDSIRYNTVYDILKDHSGRVWMASFYFRLAEYLPAENRVVTFPQDPYNPYGFDGNTAICVYEDRRHNIWIGTGSKGVYRFNPGNTTTRFYPQNDFIPGALQRGSVLCLVSIDSNSMLVGTDKGPSFYDRQSGKYINYKGSSTIVATGAVEQIQTGMPDKDGIVWMGSNRLGLLKYDTRNKTFRNFSRVTMPYPLPDDGISDILKLPDEQLMLVGYGRIGLFDPKTTKYVAYRNDTTDNDFLDLNGITNIVYDANQHVWASTGDGRLYEYDPAQRVLTDRSQWLTTVTKPLMIYKIAWQQDELFLASNRGIIRIGEKRTPYIYDLREPDNSLNEIRGILPNGDHVWFCNNRLIGRLQLTNGKIMLLGEKEGFADVQLFSRSLMKSPQGNILIGSNKGYYEIFPDRIKENTLASAAPYLTGFRIYDKPLVANKTISDITRIDLGYDQNFFSFDISAFDYNEAANIEYAYKLEGFDKDWQYIGNKRSGSYTNVPGGVYTLKLKSRTGNGEWNEEGQQVRIHISKPFWSTWWFRISLLSLVAFITWWFYKSRVNRIRKEAKMHSDYEIKLNELENSALRTQMNPHFIFNSLNTINSFINSNDRVQANRYISKFSKLVRLILDHSREKKILLKDELEVAELYMQLEQIRFENKFHFSIVTGEVDPGSVEVPPLIIQPFVENAILHGLLPADKEGVLKVEIKKSGDMLQCSIEDNGIGRQAAKDIKERSGYARKSHGMDITLKRIIFFNKENGVDEHVHITDLFTPDGKPAGTRVEIMLAYIESF